MKENQHQISFESTGTHFLSWKFVLKGQCSFEQDLEESSWAHLLSLPCSRHDQKQGLETVCAQYFIKKIFESKKGHTCFKALEMRVKILISWKYCLLMFKSQVVYVHYFCVMHHKQQRNWSFSSHKTWQLFAYQYSLNSPDLHHSLIIVALGQSNLKYSPV